MIRHWWWVFFIMVPLGLLIGLAAGYVCLFISKKYETKAVVEIVPAAGSMIPQDFLHNQSDALNAQKELVAVAEQLGLTSFGGPEITILAVIWLTGIDSGNYAKSWKDASVLFQKSVTEEQWVDAPEKVRKPLGVVTSRIPADMKKSQSLPGLPDGQYLVILFASSFHLMEKAVETVTFMHESDGSWRAAGYFIRPNP